MRSACMFRPVRDDIWQWLTCSMHGAEFSVYMGYACKQKPSSWHKLAKGERLRCMPRYTSNPYAMWSARS